MKSCDPENLGRTIVDGSIHIGRTGFERRGSPYSDFCCQESEDNSGSTEINAYHKISRPFVDTVFDLMVFLPTD